MLISKIIPIAQIVVSALLIALIMLQERSSGLSGFLGGGDSGNSFYQTRRGLEKIVFVSTIVLAIVFAIVALLDLVY